MFAKRLVEQWMTHHLAETNQDALINITIAIELLRQTPGKWVAKWINLPRAAVLHARSSRNQVVHALTTMVIATRGINNTRVTDVVTSTLTVKPLTKFAVNLAMPVKNLLQLKEVVQEVDAQTNQCLPVNAPCTSVHTTVITHS